MSRPGDQLLVYPGWLSAPVVHYTKSYVDTSEAPKAERAWVVTFVDRVGEAEGWISESGYSIEETRNFGEIYVMRLAKRDDT